MGNWSLVLKEEGNRRLPGTERAGMLCVRDGREDRDGILGGCAEGFKQAELSWRERACQCRSDLPPLISKGRKQMMAKGLGLGAGADVVKHLMKTDCDSWTGRLRESKATQT